MAEPQAHTLIYVDIGADDPDAAGRFYNEVFGWRDDDRPMGLYHRMVPGGQFLNPDGSESEIGHLHIGIFKADNVRPNPNPEGVAPRKLAGEGRRPRVWILVGDKEGPEEILKRAVDRGATVLWRDHYWKTFNGFSWAFRDPWGNEILLWVKGGDDPQIPANFTRE
jgi:predicted enzyme related to lactoylglutathione lyase